MSETDIQTIRTQLLSQRSSILNKTAEFKQTQADGTSAQRADDAEAARADMEDTMSFRMHERDRYVLLQIDRALSKMLSGTYGECESCGEHISQKRLIARPFADLCIDCQEDRENHTHKSLN